MVHDTKPIAFLGEFEHRSRHKGKPIAWLQPAYKLETPKFISDELSLPQCKPWKYGIYTPRHQTVYRGEEQVLQALRREPWLHPYVAFAESWVEEENKRKIREIK